MKAYVSNKKLDYWRNILIRINVYLYSYVFVMCITNYFFDHHPIVPNHANKVYPVLSGVPDVSQESIIMAVNNFEIQIPFMSLYPSLDMNTSKGLLGTADVYMLLSLCVPKIGPRAFESWSMLGSVLAHEVEVHCNQNWWKHFAEKLMGENTTPMLEREAYRYTLLDSDRFHLTRLEQRYILETMLYFYPTGDKNGQRQGTSEIKERTH